MSLSWCPSVFTPSIPLHAVAIGAFAYRVALPIYTLEAHVWMLGFYYMECEVCLGGGCVFKEDQVYVELIESG